jgi:hypothetical protein
MTDVFVSYKREDRERVEPLVEALTKTGLCVWWDREISGGQEWRQEITRELEASRCVIAVWSRGAVGEQGAFVRDEASRGLARGVLLPVRIDDVAPPLGFGECQALDLIGWRGSDRDTRILDVIATAQAIVQNQALPRLRWPKVKRMWRGLRYGSVGIFACGAVVVAGGSRICDVPAMRDVCVMLGVERTCKQTRESVRRYGYAARASDDGEPNETAAMATTLAEAQREAVGIVCPAPNSELLTLKSAKIEPEKWHCRQQDGKHYCAMDGWAVCTYDEQYVAVGVHCLK